MRSFGWPVDSCAAVATVRDPAVTAWFDPGNDQSDGYALSKPMAGNCQWSLREPTGRFGSVSDSRNRPVAVVRCNMNYRQVKTEIVLARLTEFRQTPPLFACVIVFQTHLDTELIRQLGGLGCVTMHIEHKWGMTNRLQREGGFAIRQIFKWLCA